mgnify:CR=1 FL=1
MGNLHDGHLRLVQEARNRCDIVVVSIFVNPTQFGVGEDFENYPRTLEADSKLLFDANCDILFSPNVSQIYGDSPQHTTVQVDAIASDLCGKSRRRPLVMARQIGMYVFRELTDYSYPKIAEEFGGRDHTTVMHADRKIRQLMAERRSLYNQVTDLTARIKSTARQA